MPAAASSGEAKHAGLSKAFLIVVSRNLGKDE